MSEAPTPVGLRLRFVRHGETDWNSEGRIQGHLDVPLNARGLAQARLMAERLADSGIERIYTSDLERARHTAEVIASRLGVPVIPEPRLRERNLGDLQGLTAADLGARDAGEAFVFRMVNDPTARPEGGESLGEFRARVAGFVTELRERPPAGDILVVTHGGAIRAAFLALLGTDRRDVLPHISNCMSFPVLVTPDGARLEEEAAGEVDEDRSLDESLAS